MSLSLTLASLWVLAAALVALLPVRAQFAPGIVLLALAPAGLVYLGMQQNIWVVLVALVALLSMFRRPLSYFARHIFGGRR